MRPIQIITSIGACVAAGGICLALAADSLATRWQPTQSGNGWGGITDPGLRHTYQTLGIIGLCFGLVLFAVAAWHWLARGNRTLHA